MIGGRILGWVFLVAGLVVLARDFMVSFAEKHWAPIALGQLWYDLDRTSLDFVQGTIKRNVGYGAWSVIDAMLICWASVAMIVIGIALLIVSRRPQAVVPE
jgi:hypothetical protein